MEASNLVLTTDSTNYDLGSSGMKWELNLAGYDGDSLVKTYYCEKCGQVLGVKDKTRLEFDINTGNPVRRGNYVYRCPTGKKSHTKKRVAA